jgi:benzoyl-CoA reductase/2-hydroxyglutaryl-CoA dehydratase subunit BcrC/BadD/HgdB
MPDIPNVGSLPRIGYLYSYLPPEILYAFGRVPVRILPAGCNPAEVEPYLPKNFCTLAKLLLAACLDGAAPSTAVGFETVVFTDHCDAQRRLCDVWRAHGPTPVLAFLDLPRRADQLGVQFYAATLARFVSQCEQHFGQTLAADKLADSICVYNSQRFLWDALRRAWADGCVPTSQYYALRDRRLTADPVVANAEIENALKEAAGSISAAAVVPRLLLMGSLQVNRGLLALIEQDGRARVVAEESACDEREAVTSILTDGSLDELLAALAQHYLDVPAPRLRDLPRRLSHIGRLVEARHVDGVICSYYKFCDPYLAEFPVVKHFLEARRVPVLLLEDEGAAVFSGQARTRLEAFLEILSSRRESSRQKPESSRHLSDD